MKKFLVILLISSILLTQCYTQNEYLTKDYAFNNEDDLKKVVLKDGTEREFSFNEYLYKVETDSQLITFNSKREIIGNQVQFVSVTDTLNLAEIQSLFISELNVGTTAFLLTVAGVFLVIVMYLEGSGLGRSWTL